MATETNPLDRENPPPEHPQARLERSFVEAYLLSKGYHWKDIPNLPAELARTLMIEASIFASNKLAEIETRSRLINELHGEVD